MQTICVALRDSIKTRFNHVFTSGDADSDPLYLCAAALDPMVFFNSAVMNQVQKVKLARVIKEMVIFKTFNKKLIFY
jgi:hypothetical protein